MAEKKSVHEIVGSLRRLQTLDNEVHDVRESRDAMIHHLDRLRSVLSNLDTELTDKREKLAEAETWYTKKSGELENEKDKLAKAKSKLAGVTKSREYVAVNRELDSLRRGITHREDEVQRLEVAIHEFRATIEAEEQKIADLRSQADLEAANNETRLTDMSGQITDVESRRKALSDELPSNVFRRYEKVAKRRDGVGIVRVSDGVCLGCQMVIQPRFIEQLLRNSSLLACPSCGRYLYIDEDEEAREAADRAAAQAAEEAAADAEDAAEEAAEAAAAAAAASDASSEAA
jgi:predicted  nucleic acid-binding Zn-ribbon protein